MFEGLRRWWRGEESVDSGARGPIPEDAPGDWVVMPYRMAEACRISMYTIASHPDMPQQLHQWIAQWLQGYNASLAKFFGDVYGPDIFPVLEKITEGVKKASEQFYEEEAERQLWDSFKQWEEELNGRRDGREPPSTSPSAG